MLFKTAAKAFGSLAVYNKRLEEKTEQSDNGDLLNLFKNMASLNSVIEKRKKQ